MPLDNVEMRQEQGLASPAVARTWSRLFLRAQAYAPELFVQMVASGVRTPNGRGVLFRDCRYRLWLAEIGLIPTCPSDQPTRMLIPVYGPVHTDPTPNEYHAALVTALRPTEIAA